MGKPTAKEKAEREKAAKETLWWHAKRGNAKAKEALKKDTRGRPILGDA